MFHIKICGITRPEDAAAAVKAGAGAVGLNFYAKSPRLIDLAKGRAVLAAAGSEVARVGVFVNTPAEEIASTADALELSHIQLHGDEPPETLAQLAGRDIIRAWRMDGRGIAPLAEYLEKCDELGALPTAVLIDAHQPGEYGGTGTQADWELLVDQRSQLGGLPLILAGGLNCENIEEAIASVKPSAVDTASGVEASPGIKDPETLAQFIALAPPGIHRSGVVVGVQAIACLHSLLLGCHWLRQ